MAVRIETTATDRKKLVKAIAEFLGENSIYLGPPTFGYQIGEITVDKESTVITENEQKAEEVRQMLTEQGFLGEAQQEGAEEQHSIKVPLGTDEAGAVVNLMNLLHSKQYLINKALGNNGFKVNDALITALENTQFATAAEAAEFITAFDGSGHGFSFDDGCIVFSGFPHITEGNKNYAYCELSAAMVKAAREQKRISSKETIEENEKYYMRVWLVRLGFDGELHKESRRILLEKLKGHTAFKTEADKQRWNERQKERKARVAERRAEENGVSEEGDSGQD